MPNPTSNIDLSTAYVAPKTDVIPTHYTAATDPGLAIARPSTVEATGDPFIRVGDVSQYDAGYTPTTSETGNPNDPIEEYRAQAQSIPVRIASGIGRLGLVSATKLGTSLGYLGAAIGYGVADAINPDKHFNNFVSDVVDNGWSTVFDKAEETVKNDWLPIYKTNAYKNGSIWDQMQTASFWTDDTVDGLAFAAAFFAPGAALALLGVGSKIASGLAGLGKAAEVGADIADTASGLAKAAEVTGAITDEAGVVGGTIAKTTYAAASPKNAFLQGLMDFGKAAAEKVSITPRGVGELSDRIMTTAMSVHSDAMFEAKDARDQTIEYWKTQKDPLTGEFWKGDEPFILERAGIAAAGIYKSNLITQALAGWIEAGAILTPFSAGKRALGNVVEKGIAELGGGVGEAGVEATASTAAEAGVNAAAEATSATPEIAAKRADHFIRNTMIKNVAEQAAVQGPYARNMQISLQAMYGKTAKSESGIPPDLVDSWGEVASNMAENFTTTDGLKQIVVGSTLGVMMGLWSSFGKAKQEKEHGTLLEQTIKAAAIAHNTVYSDLFMHENDASGKSVIKYDSAGNPIIDTAKVEGLGYNIAGQIESDNNLSLEAAHYNDHLLADRVVHTKLAALLKPLLGFKDSIERAHDMIDAIGDKQKQLAGQDDYIGDTPITIDQKIAKLKEHASMFSKLYDRVNDRDMYINEPFFKDDTTGNARADVRDGMYTALTDNYIKSVDNNGLSALRDKILAKPVDERTDRDAEALDRIDTRIKDNNTDINDNSTLYNKLNTKDGITELVADHNAKRDAVLKEHEAEVVNDSVKSFSLKLKMDGVKLRTPNLVKAAEALDKVGKNTAGTDALNQHFKDIDTANQVIEQKTKDTDKKAIIKTDNNLAVESTINSTIGEHLDIPAKYVPVEHKAEYDTNPIIKDLLENTDKATNLPFDPEKFSELTTSDEKQYVVNQLLKRLGHTAEEDIKAPVEVLKPVETGQKPVETAHKSNVIDKIVTGIKDLTHKVVKGLASDKHVPVKQRTDIEVIYGDGITKIPDTAHITRDKSISNPTTGAMEIIQQSAHESNLIDFNEKKVIVQDLISKTKTGDDIKDIQTVFKTLHDRTDWNPKFDKIAINEFLNKLGYNGDSIHEVLEPTNSNPNLAETIPDSVMKTFRDKGEISKTYLTKIANKIINEQSFTPYELELVNDTDISDAVNTIVDDIRRTKSLDVLSPEEKEIEIRRSKVKILPAPGGKFRTVLGEKDGMVTPIIADTREELQSLIAAKYDEELNALKAKKEEVPQGDKPSEVPETFNRLNSIDKIRTMGYSEEDILNMSDNNMIAIITNSIVKPKIVTLDAANAIKNETFSSPSPMTQGRVYGNIFDPDPSAHPKGTKLITRDSENNVILPPDVTDAYLKVKQLKVGDTMEIMVDTDKIKTVNGVPVNHEGLPIDKDTLPIGMGVTGTQLFMMNQTSYLNGEVNLTDRLLGVTSDLEKGGNKLNILRGVLNELSTGKFFKSQAITAKAAIDEALGKDFLGDKYNLDDLKSVANLNKLVSNLRNKLNYGKPGDTYVKTTTDYNTDFAAWNVKMLEDLAMNNAVRAEIWDAHSKGLPVTVKMKIESITNGAVETSPKRAVGITKVFDETDETLKDAILARRGDTGEYTNIASNTTVEMNRNRAGNRAPMYYITKETLNGSNFAIPLMTRLVNPTERNTAHRLLTDILDYAKGDGKNGNSIGYKNLKGSSDPNAKVILDKIARLKDVFQVTTSSYEPGVGAMFDIHLFDNANPRSTGAGYNRIGIIRVRDAKNRLEYADYDIFITDMAHKKNGINVPAGYKDKGAFAFALTVAKTEKGKVANKSEYINTEEKIKEVLDRFNHNVNFDSLKNTTDPVEKQRRDDYQTHLLKNVFTTDTVRINDEQGNKLGVANVIGQDSHYNGIYTVSPFKEGEVPIQPKVISDISNEDWQQYDKLATIPNDALNIIANKIINGEELGNREKQFKLINGWRISERIDELQGAPLNSDKVTIEKTNLESVIGKEGSDKVAALTAERITVLKGQRDDLMEQIDQIESDPTLDESTRTTLLDNFNNNITNIENELTRINVPTFDITQTPTENASTTEKVITKLASETEPSTVLDKVTTGTDISNDTMSDEEFMSSLQKEVDGSNIDELPEGAGKITDPGVTITPQTPTSDTDTLGLTVKRKLRSEKQYGPTPEGRVINPVEVKANWERIFGDTKTLIIDTNPLMWMSEKHHGIFHSAMSVIEDTILSPTAEKYSEYHEAFHRIVLFGLTPERKIEVFDEAKVSYDTPNATDDQIEERLAEDYRKYRITSVRDPLYENQYGIFGMKFPKAITNFFDNMIRYVNIFLGKSPMIHQLFQDIDAGKFKGIGQTTANMEIGTNLVSRFNSRTQEDAVGSTLGLLQGIYLDNLHLTIKQYLAKSGGIKNAIRLTYDEAITKRNEQILERENQIDNNTIVTDANGKVIDLEADHAKLNSQRDALLLIRDDLRDNKDTVSIMNIALRKFEELHHIKISDVDEETDISEMNQPMTKAWDEDAAFKKTDENGFNPVTRLIINGLKDKTITVDYGKPDKITDAIYESTGLEKFVDYYAYKNKLHELTIDSLTKNDMLKRIEDAIPYLPVLKELHDILTSNPTFLNAFYSDFHKTSIEELNLNIKPTDGSTKIALKVLNKENHFVLADKWSYAVKSTAYSGKTEQLFGKYKPANRYLKTSKVDPKDDLNYSGNKFFNDISDKYLKGKYDIKTAIDKLVEASSMLGIDLTTDDINLLLRYNMNTVPSDKIAKSIDDTLNDTFDTLNRIRLNVIGNAKNPKGMFDNYDDLNSLSKVISTYTLNANESSFLDNNNERKFKEKLPNTISTLNTILNARLTDPDAIAARNQFISDIQKISVFKYSNWFGKIDPTNIEQTTGQANMINADGTPNLSSGIKLFIDGGIANSATKNTVDANKMNDDEWTIKLLSNYILNKKGESEDIVRLAMPGLSDSKQVLFAQVNRIKLLAEHITNYNPNEFAISHTSPMFTALWNIVRQEHVDMIDATKLLFTTTIDPVTKKPIRTLNDVTKIDKNKMLKYFHYQDVDEKGNPILMKDGKVTGNVFKFHDFEGINDLNLFDDTGVLRTIPDDTNTTADTLGSDIMKREVNKVIDEWVKDEVKKNYTNMSDILRDRSTSLLHDAEYIHLDEDGKSYAENVDDRVAHIVGELSLNGKVAMVESQNLLFGKTAEFKDAIMTNKRAKGIWSNGTGSFSDGVIKMQTVSDVVLPSTMFDTYHATVKTDLIHNYGFLNPDNLKGKSKKFAQTNLDAAIESTIGIKGRSGYGKINVADGQGLSSPTRMVNILKERGIFDTFANQFETFKNKNGEERYRFVEGLKLDDIATVVRVTKGFIYDRSYNEDLNRLKTNMVKYSSMPLINDVIRGTELGKLLDYMDEAGIDELIFESAQKRGVTVPATIHNSDGSLKTDFVDQLNSYGTDEVPASSWVNQQDVSDHVMDHKNKLGSQIAVQMLANLSDKADYMSELNATGKSMTGDEIFKHTLSLVSKNIEDDGKSVRDELKLDSLNPSERYEAISKVLEKQFRNKTTNAGELKSIGYNPITKTNNMDLDMSILNYKIQSTLTSMFTNSVVNQKFPGGHVVLASAAFWGEDPTYTSQTDAEKRGIQIGGKLKSVFNTDGTLKYVECVMPPYSKHFFNADGELKVDLNNVPDFLKEVIGYRIPTSGKHSSVVLHVKQFLPRSAGPMIIVADDIVERMGSDFDVDSLFLMTPTFVKTTEGLTGTDHFNIPNESHVTAGKATARDLRNNEILANYKAILRSPSHSVESIMGAKYYDSEEVRDTIDKEIGENDNSIDVTSLSGQNIFRSKAQLGKTILEIAASFSTGITKLQGVKAQLPNSNRISWDYSPDELGITDATQDVDIRRLNLKYGANNVKLSRVEDGTISKVTISHRNIGWNFDKSFTNANGQLITFVIGQSVDHSADAVKSPLLRNFNSTTANVKLGLESLGIPSLHIARLLNQDSVVKYVIEQNKGNVNTSKSNAFALSNTLDNLFVNLYEAKVGHEMNAKGISAQETDTYKKYSAIIDNTGKIDMTTATKRADVFNYFGISETGQTMMNATLKNGLEHLRDTTNGTKDYNPTSDLNYAKNQINALLWYKDLNDKVAIINRSIAAVNVDKLSAGPKISDSVKVLQNIRDVNYTVANEEQKIDGKMGLVYDNTDKPLMEAIYPSVFKDEVTQEETDNRLYPVLETYLNNAHNVVATKFNDIFITETPEYKQFIDEFNSALGYLSRNTRESLEKQIIYFVNTLIYDRVDELNTTIPERQELMGVKGDKSLAKRIIAAKEELGIRSSDAHVLNFIQYGVDDLNQSNNGYIRTFTTDTNNEPNTENSILDSMNKMYFTPTTLKDGTTTKDLVSDIVKVSYIENKLAYGANSTAKFIPYDILGAMNIIKTWHDQKNETIKKSLASAGLTFIDNFLLMQSFRNDIAPIVETKYAKVKTARTESMGENVPTVGVVGGKEMVEVAATDEMTGERKTKGYTPDWKYFEATENGIVIGRGMKIPAARLYKETSNIRDAKLVKIRNNEYDDAEKEHPGTQNKYRTFYKMYKELDTNGNENWIYREVNTRSLIDLPSSTESIIERNNQAGVEMADMHLLVIEHNMIEAQEKQRLAEEQAAKREVSNADNQDNKDKELNCVPF